MIGPGTVTPQNFRRRRAAFGVPSGYDSYGAAKVVCGPRGWHQLPIHCNIRNSTAFRCFSPDTCS